MKEIKVSDFCDKTNKDFIKYYKFLNNPKNMKTIYDFMQFMYLDEFKERILDMIKKNRKSLMNYIETSKILMKFYERNKLIQKSEIGTFFSKFKSKINNFNVNSDKKILNLFYEVLEYPNLLSVLKECFYLFGNYRTCLLTMIPKINFYKCEKYQIDEYVKYFHDNQNMFVTLISKVSIGDKTPWGSMYYSSAYAMFETLNIMDRYYLKNGKGTLSKLKISESITPYTLSKKIIYKNLLKKFEMNRFEKKNKMENILSVSSFIIVLKKMGYDLWFTIPLVFDTIYKYNFKGIQESKVIGYKKIYHQKMNFRIGIMCYILKLDGFLTSVNILNNFND